MGVLTTAYAISPLQMRKIRANEDNLGFLLGVNEEKSAKWKVEKHEFDKHFEETIEILRVCGYQKTFYKLNFENYFDPKHKNFWNYAGFNLWAITPAEGKIISGELIGASFETLKTNGLLAKATDYFGNIIPEEMYQHYVGDIETIKVFFRETAAQGNYLLFAAA